MDGRATFTIAMSSTTMNWTPRSSASANHFRRVAAIMVAVLSVVELRLAKLQHELFFCKYPLVNQKLTGYTTTNGGKEIRPVLPDGPRALARRRALGVAGRPRAHARAQALYRPRSGPTRDRHQHPCRTSARPRGVRRRREAQAPA